jgi:hypothetical protein
MWLWCNFQESLIVSIRLIKTDDNHFSYDNFV